MDVRKQVSVISIKNIHKYFGKNHIIRDISLEIKDQSFTVLVGPSGCGKSTILRMIAGLESIDSGTISIGGIIANDLQPKERDIAMVFQSYALYPHMTVFDNMAFGLKIERLSKDEIHERVLDAAKILQIENYLQRKPKQLSGGQRQRVAIGRAITRQPKVFLFDEPLSNLDASLRVQMRVELAKLHDQLEATMVYVTHDQTEAMTMADEIVVLEKGSVSQIGEPLQLYNNPFNNFVAGFIGSPKMNFLDGKVVDLGNNETIIETIGSTIIKFKKEYDGIKLGSDVVCGIRPEHLLTEADFFPVWVGKVVVVEKLGSGSFLYLEKSGDPLVVETSGDSNVKVGDSINIYFNQEKCHLFSKENGVALLEVVQSEQKAEKV